MEEATGAPSSFAVSHPRRLRASGRDEGRVMIRPSSPLTMLLSRHTRGLVLHPLVPAKAGTQGHELSASGSGFAFAGMSGGPYFPVLILVHSRFISRCVFGSWALMV